MLQFDHFLRHCAWLYWHHVQLIKSPANFAGKIVPMEMELPSTDLVNFAGKSCLKNSHLWNSSFKQMKEKGFEIEFMCCIISSSQAHIFSAFLIFVSYYSAIHFFFLGGGGHHVVSVLTKLQIINTINNFCWVVDTEKFVTIQQTSWSWYQSEWTRHVSVCQD